MDQVVDIRELNERIERRSAFVDALMMGMNQTIVGQKHLVESLLIGLLSDGHILLEGVPGLAKTLAIKTLAQLIDADFSRIQFTPDLLPADVVGTLIYSQKTDEFTVKKGPVFANFILADEINRAPAKVQSALLEAMQERQVTIGEETFDLPKPFLVMATQNPIEQEGTYPLPEAQVDRFMLKVVVNYPQKEEEKLILRQNIAAAQSVGKPILKLQDILEAREVVRSAMTKANEMSDEILADTGREVARMKARAEADIAQERKRAANALKDDVADLSMEIAEKVIGREIGEDDHRALIDDCIKELQ